MEVSVQPQAPAAPPPSVPTG